MLIGPRSSRVLISAVFALALTSLPIVQVAACDCALTTIPEAVAEADLAIVGTLVGRAGAGREPLRAVPEPLRLAEPDWTWQVEASRDPIAAGEVTIRAWEGDGANCGVAFATGERWLVIAYADGPTLETNGCLPNHRIDGSDPEAEALIASLLPVSATGSTRGVLSVPVPALIVLVAIALVVGVSFLAFGRERVR